MNFKKIIKTVCLFCVVLTILWLPVNKAHAQEVTDHMWAAILFNERWDQFRPSADVDTLASSNIQLETYHKDGASRWAIAFKANVEWMVEVTILDKDLKPLLTNYYIRAPFDYIDPRIDWLIISPNNTPSLEKAANVQFRILYPDDSTKSTQSILIPISKAVVVPDNEHSNYGIT